MQASRTTLRPELRETADRVAWLAASIDAVQGRAVNRFSACLEALEKVAGQLETPLAIVGGIAAIHHHAEVTTKDVDVAVAREKLDAILEVAPRHGLRLVSRSGAGWHQFSFAHPEGDVPVHVVPEGGKMPRDPEYAPPNPSPRWLGVDRGLGYAAFAPWAAIKLIAGRVKDHYHLVEALKHASEAQVAAVVQLLRPLHASYLSELGRLLKAAEEERQAGR